MKMGTSVPIRGDTRCKDLEARLDSAPQNIAEYAKGFDASIKGHCEMTDKSETVLTDAHLLNTYRVPDIARPWLTVNTARNKTTGLILSWATQSNITNFNHA